MKEIKTSLFKKLGIKDKNRILVLNSPKPYQLFFDRFPKEVNIYNTSISELVKFAHIFIQNEKELERYYLKGKKAITKDGMLWISWPKKSSKIPSEVYKTDIRNYGLSNGLVDVKVVSIDEDWSGQKFVYRLTDR